MRVFVSLLFPFVDRILATTCFSGDSLRIFGASLWLGLLHFLAHTVIFLHVLLKIVAKWEVSIVCYGNNQ